MQETQVQSLGWEDLLEKEIATHSSILVCKVQWTAEPGRLESMGSQRVGHIIVTEHTHTHAEACTVDLQYYISFRCTAL